MADVVFTADASAQGPQGPIGPAGPAGTTGPAGQQGSQGPEGNKGDRGPSIPGYAGSSTTSLTIGTGSKTFTIQAELNYDVGMRVRIAYSTNPANNYMEGLITDYTGTSMTVNVTDIYGTGTYAVWNIAPGGAQGQQGIQGVKGPTGDTGPPGPTGIYGTPINGKLTRFYSSTEIENSSYVETDLLVKAGNLSGIADAATARSNIGSAASATSAPIASPIFTGTPLVPNVTYPDDSTKIANTGFVVDAISTVSGGMPPSGTRMFFQQTAAPTGWTKDTDQSDKALRLVNGTASSGGNAYFSTLFGRTATDNHILTEAEMPSHRHEYTYAGDIVRTSDATIGTFALGSEVIAGMSSGSISFGAVEGIDQYLTSGNTEYAGSSNGHAHPIDMRIKYVDVIIAVRN